MDCSGGDVPQVRIPEEALNQVWEPLQPDAGLIEATAAGL
jgi:hypothetical protein